MGVTCWPLASGDANHSDTTNALPSISCLWLMEVLSPGYAVIYHKMFKIRQQSTFYLRLYSCCCSELDLISSIRYGIYFRKCLWYILDHDFVIVSDKSCRERFSPNSFYSFLEEIHCIRGRGLDYATAMNEAIILFTRYYLHKENNRV